MLIDKNIHLIYYSNIDCLYQFTPISVCIVLENCQYGSLSDLLRGSRTSSGVRQPIKLSYSDWMFIALGCARGLEAVHGYSSELCHRDIKSFNYLIDSQLNAKIADLELGELIDLYFDEYGNELSDSHDAGALQLSIEQSLAINGGVNAKPRKKAVMETGDMNITWQAPEVLLGQSYTQKSDIHSLAMVLWEIAAAGKPPVAKYVTVSSSSPLPHHNSGDPLASPGDSAKASTIAMQSAPPTATIPYADLCRGNQEELRALIVRGVRPNISNLSRGLDPMYISIMVQAWHPEPSSRPTITEVVKVLQRCWSNSLHRYLTQYYTVLCAIYVHRR